MTGGRSELSVLQKPRNGKCWSLDHLVGAIEPCGWIGIAVNRWLPCTRITRSIASREGAVGQIEDQHFASSTAQATRLTAPVQAKQDLDQTSLGCSNADPSLFLRYEETAASNGGLSDAAMSTGVGSQDESQTK